MRKTVVPGVWSWSRWQPDRGLDFNGFFVETPGGNLVVDPIEPDDQTLAELRERGVAAVLVTNRDHERSTAAVAAATGAQVIASALDAPLLAHHVDRTVVPGEIVFGWTVVGLDGFKTAGEIVLYDRARRAAIVGDALWGTPAGALTLMPDAKLADPRARRAVGARAARVRRRPSARRRRRMRVRQRARRDRRDARRARGRVREPRQLSTSSTSGQARRSRAVRRRDGRGRAADRRREARATARRGSAKARYSARTTGTRARKSCSSSCAGRRRCARRAARSSLRAGRLRRVLDRRRAARTSCGTTPTTKRCVLLIANTDPGDVCFYPDSRKFVGRSDGHARARQPPARLLRRRDASPGG